MQTLFFQQLFLFEIDRNIILKRPAEPALATAVVRTLHSAKRTVSALRTRIDVRIVSVYISVVPDRKGAAFRLAVITTRTCRSMRMGRPVTGVGALVVTVGSFFKSTDTARSRMRTIAVVYNLDRTTYLRTIDVIAHGASFSVPMIIGITPHFYLLRTAYAFQSVPKYIPPSHFGTAHLSLDNKP